MVAERRKARTPMDASGSAWWRDTLEEAAGEVWGTVWGREDKQGQSQSQSAVPGSVRNLAAARWMLLGGGCGTQGRVAWLGGVLGPGPGWNRHFQFHSL